VFDVADLGLAESALHAPAATYGGVEFYPDLVTKARVILAHLTKNHPLPDGNKRAAYLAMIEFLARNGRQFVAADVDATIDMMVKIAGSEVRTGRGRGLDQAAAPLNCFWAWQANRLPISAGQPRRSWSSRSVTHEV
jgi:prophage maintenance system killer protein